jgi:16S rRNA (guanine966-N2)-methyltransferase|tara:strand:+ start:918 stop:1481 length:564 start_codon:yes stop_codon:yes gene_type:complete
MRIISGTSKGKRLYEPKDLLTRPLKDLTKESIFNIICHSNKFNVALEDANILDLFSGTGSFGLECLSRGSKHVTFVENYKKILPILKKNIIGLNYEKNSKIIEMDINNSLSFKVFQNQFNIIFLDPPYKEKKLFQILENIIQFNLLKDEGVVIIHRHKKEIDKFPKRLKIIEDKLYGISRVFFGSYI